MKVYVLQLDNNDQGDHEIIGVFSTKAAAEKLLPPLDKVCDTDWFHVEEYELDVVTEIDEDYLQ